MPRLLATLVIISLISAAIGLSLPDLPAAALLHMILALGIMPLILAAMAYFIPVLTRTSAPEPRVLLAPIGALIAGLLATLSLSLNYQLYPVATTIALLAVGGLLWWSQQRAKATLGRPHPGLLWYQLALGSLIIGLLIITLAAFWPAQWLPLRRLHLHINLLGFVGLAALGTLRVLLPTAGGFPDPQAGVWLMKEWRWLVAGTLLIAAGAAWSVMLADIGLLLWLIALVRLVQGLLKAHQGRLWQWHGAAASLMIAVAGLMLCLVGGALHGHGLLPASQASEAFVIAFLLPLVTGAATHLLPLWRLSSQPEQQQQLRERLGYLSMVRGLAFLAAGLLTLLSQPWAFWIAIAALCQFLAQLTRPLSKHK
ncbi:MAG: hypothetical protein L3J26_06485 [Candidatus Polarisedimenticolaceae bacterium]|nr:hypothetical protein [Candidatus Polarisedimenticolaceae bacterium]